MTDNNRRDLSSYIDKDRWWDTLSRFIDVLRINMFMINVSGELLLPPDVDRFGGGLLMDNKLGFDLIKENHDMLSQFEDHGAYLETISHYLLHSYALPVKFKNNEVAGYLIIGPVILNARLTSSNYREMAEEYQADPDEVFDELLELRVVSNVMMQSILKMFTELIRDHVDYAVAQEQLKAIKDSVPEDDSSSKEVADEIYATVRKDELLATLLDVAMNMTQAECGSIMLVDANGEYLSVKAFRGLNKNRLKKTQKIGEGISGWVAQNNEALYLDGMVNQSNNRVAQWMKRPEIKEAAIVPLVVNDRVMGVLNLHSTTESGQLKDSLSNLQHLSGLLSATL